MPFRLADVKKTVRSRSDGHRYLHPRLLKGPSVTAQAGLALAYLHSRLGRVRREVDAETLVRFFGDPKIARGLMACLNMTYQWRTQEFAEVLTSRQVARLSRRGLLTPCDLRLYLYDRLNRDGDGFLDAPRDERLAPLATALGLDAAKLDQLVALDAADNAVLVRVGPAPEPEQVVAAYNFQVVDALLRNSVALELHGAGPAARDRLVEACAAYSVSLKETAEAVVLQSAQDVFGSYARAGGRLVRALYTAAASAPSLLTSGYATVAVPGKSARYELSCETLGALTAGTGAIHCAAPWDDLRALWARHRAAQGTKGWRLDTWPDPHVSVAGLSVAPYLARRGESRVLLWPVEGAIGLDGAAQMQAAGVAVLPIVQDAALLSGAWDGLAVERSDGIAGLLAALSEHWGGDRVSVGAQALDGLLDEVAAHGFIPEARVQDVLQCVSTRDLAARLRFLDPDRAIYVAGVGLCSAAFAAGMRKGLRRKHGQTSAA